MIHVKTVVTNVLLTLHILERARPLPLPPLHGGPKFPPSSAALKYRVGTGGGVSLKALWVLFRPYASEPLPAL